MLLTPFFLKLTHPQSPFSCPSVESSVRPISDCFKVNIAFCDVPHCREAIKFTGELSYAVMLCRYGPSIIKLNVEVVYRELDLLYRQYL